MSNVLNEEKKQQVIALGRLGWSLRRIEQDDRGASGDGRRLSESGRDRRAPPGAWGRRAPAKPANEVTTGADQPTPLTAKPASDEVITDSGGS